MSSYGRGKRTENASERINYKKLAGETYDNEEDDDDNDMISVVKKDGKTIHINNNYVNKHIPQLMFRSYSESDLHEAQQQAKVDGTMKDDDVIYKIQYIEDGSELNVENLLDSQTSLSLHLPILVKDKPESIGIRVPKPSSKKGKGVSSITIRDIGNMVGMNEPITIMDCRTQEEVEGWIFRDLIDYFEDDDRLYQSRKCQKVSDRVLNQISLEFSHTSMKQCIRSPLFVRQLDWIDNIWPGHLRSIGHFPRVQFYCLTSTSGCFTDCHIDFGGTSVWYHVLSGRKMFLLIPPTERNLQLYELWLCSKDQSNIFFPDMVDEHGQGGVGPCIRITLEECQTLVIPTGWIHAVYTPVDSIVIGGNFLHGLDMKGQIDIHSLETRTRVPAKFKFPFFIPLCFYAGVWYLKVMLDSESGIHHEEATGLSSLIQSLKLWSDRQSLDLSSDGDKVGTLAHCFRECTKLLEEINIKDVSSMIEALEVELKNVRVNGVYKSRGRNQTTRSVSPNSESDTTENMNMASDLPRIRLSLPGSKDRSKFVKEGAKPKVGRQKPKTTCRERLKKKLKF